MAYLKIKEPSLFPKAKVDFIPKSNSYLFSKEGYKNRGRNSINQGGKASKAAEAACVPPLPASEETTAEPAEAMAQKLEADDVAFNNNACCTIGSQRCAWEGASEDLPELQTLPPAALLRRPKITATQMLAESLRRANTVQHIAESQRFKRFVDAVVEEYISQEAAQRRQLSGRESLATGPAPAQAQADKRPRASRRATSRRTPTPTCPTPACSTAACRPRFPGDLDYCALVRKVNKPLYPNELLRMVQLGQVMQWQWRQCSRPRPHPRIRPCVLAAFTASK